MRFILAGRALFNLAIKPVFDSVRPSTREAYIQQTKIYFSGIESSTQVQIANVSPTHVSGGVDVSGRESG